MFSRTVRYALSAMTVLARRAPEVVPATELAQELGIPANYLSKTLDRLRGEGLLEAVRGRGGGFRLARPARGISLAEVSNAIEPLDPSRQCLMGNGTCSDVGGCPAHHAWKAVSAPVIQFLEEHTLEELAHAPVAWPPSLERVS